ncbi:helix-turn-helix domain-containing protein [Streptomyces sp. PDY-4]|uniref:helix-turn-helix domain-containing protein n=1 Tax=Streptomyces sp. PDY-4 TaxID=3376070 RepID=UPI0037A60CB4
MSEGTAAAEFAARLRELKERSGLSYGVLAKRLHMSTSTLHRYCNGDAVPAEYAPVERLARLCKAGPGELVELHRRWVLADAARGRKGTPAEAVEPAATAPAAETETGVAATGTGVAETQPAAPDDGPPRDEVPEVTDFGAPRPAPVPAAAPAPPSSPGSRWPPCSAGSPSA